MVKQNKMKKIIILLLILIPSISFSQKRVAPTWLNGDSAVMATRARVMKSIDSIAGVSSYINIVKRSGFDSLAYLNNSTGVLNIKAIQFSGTGFTWTATITDTTLSQSLAIDNSSITKAKIENVAVGRVLGNATTSAAAPSETGAWISLTTGTASGAATIDIDLSNYYTVYDEIKISFFDLRPATDNVSLYMRISADGSTYASAASDYKYQILYGVGAAAGGIQGTGNAQILLANNVDNTSTNMNNLDVLIKKPGQSTLKPMYGIRFDYVGDSGPAYVTTVTTGLRDNAQVTRGVRFLTSSGNISGSYSVTGIKY